MAAAFSSPRHGLPTVARTPPAFADFSIRAAQRFRAASARCLSTTTEQATPRAAEARSENGSRTNAALAGMRANVLVPDLGRRINHAADDQAGARSARRRCEQRLDRWAARLLDQCRPLRDLLLIFFGFATRRVVRLPGFFSLWIGQFDNVSCNCRRRPGGAVDDNPQWRSLI